jgi:hypothetical protein
MKQLNDAIREYTKQLQSDSLITAYTGIIKYMSGLRTFFTNKHPELYPGTFYPGYMDMTYFALTPPPLKDKKLKIAIVYLHKEARFEAWLGGVNRHVQSEYIERLEGRSLGRLHLSRVSPGVDSILEEVFITDPDFERQEDLTRILEEKTITFIDDVLLLIGA